MDMDTIIDDSGDTTVITSADGPADTSAQKPEPSAEPPAPEAEGESSAPAEEEAISVEAARKIRSENKALRERMRAQEEALEEARKAQMTEQERAIEEAKAAVAADYEKRIVGSRLRERAAGKLANPADVELFVDTTGLTVDSDDADLDLLLADLLEARPYLAAQKPGAPQIDQGPIPQRPKGRSFNDLLNEHLGPRR